MQADRTEPKPGQHLVPDDLGPPRNHEQVGTAAPYRVQDFGGVDVRGRNAGDLMLVSD